jgi:hypothetical protein
MFSDPRYPLDFVPESERPSAEALRNSLTDLRMFVQRFDAAITLNEHSRELLFARGENALDAGKWSLIACRDAAMSIWLFGEGLRIARTKLLPRCPTLLAAADHKKTRQLDGRYTGLFPGYKRIRHALSHFAHTPTEGDLLDRATQKKKVVVIVSSSLRDRTFGTTHNGELFEFDLTGETADKLKMVESQAHEVYGAIFAAAKATSA